MKIKNNIGKKAVVPVVTLAFLLTSQVPAVNVSKVIMEEGRFEKAIVEIYRGEKVAAAPAVDYNQVPKNYEVKVYEADKAFQG